MAVTPLKLFHGVVPSPEAGIYTSPGGVVLRKIIVVNTSGAGAAFSMSIAGQRVVNGKNVPTADFLPLVLSVPLGTGDVITALTSAVNALTVLGVGWSFS